jgi:hypothetical protein
VSDPGALEDLRHHWGEAYEISYRLGQYRAVRRDDRSVVRADSASELLEAIRADYAGRPVLRPGPGKDNGSWLP